MFDRPAVAATSGMAEEAPASPSTARRVEETYLADRTLDWLEAFVGQNLRSLGLFGLEGVLRNGKVLRFVADKLGNNADSPSAFSKEDLTEERKGFRAVSDVDFFLGTCRSIGLADHQLFSASDVIACGGGEEGTLRVCRTVRSLSVSCRERGIQVSLNPKTRAHLPSSFPLTKLAAWAHSLTSPGSAVSRRFRCLRRASRRSRPGREACPPLRPVTWSRQSGRSSAWRTRTRRVSQKSGSSNGLWSSDSWRDWVLQWRPGYWDRGVCGSRSTFRDCQNFFL